jgi:hypothetical protein
MTRALRALVVLLLCAPPAAAEVELQSLRWQLSSKEKAPTGKPLDLTQLTLTPGAALKGRLSAKVKLLNRGAAVEGVLLRYTVSAKIDRLREDHQEAAWALPFVTDEEKRVPKVGANQYLETALDPTAFLELYLKRLYREGFWPRELKLQVMVEPRKTDDGQIRILESALPIGQ